jgi:predicted nucleic acid-binding protein
LNPYDPLVGISRVFLDSAPVIYFVENNPIYASRTQLFFDAAVNGAITLVTSTVTLAECLVGPAHSGNRVTAQAFIDLLTREDNAEFRVPGIEEAQVCARLRAQYGLKLADALPVAVALTSGCDAILTNDTQLRRVAELRVIVLDDLALS